MLPPKWKCPATKCNASHPDFVHTHPDEEQSVYRVPNTMFASDPVNHPAHYTRGKIEVLDFIEDQQLSYHLGQVVKYVCRAGYKDKGTLKQDLQKAEFYLKRAIANVDERPITADM